MDEEALRPAREKADAFYDAMKAEVKKELEPQLEKDVYAPLRELESKEIAAENEARKKAGKPELSGKELEQIKARYAAKAESQAAPILTRAEIEKLGATFDTVVAAQKLPLIERTFFLPAPGGMGRDFRQREREAKLDPELGFLRYSAGIDSLQKAGEVLGPVEDGEDAAYVVKLTAVRPADWAEMDPATYRDLTMQMAGGMVGMGASAMDRFEPAMFERRYRLVTEFRHRPDEEQAPETMPESTPTPPANQ